MPGQEIVVVPDDMAIENADREARALLDFAPASPGVDAIQALADRLVKPDRGISKAQLLQV